jgi:lipopolysaccharide transport system ATP-binding protein
MSDVAVRVEGLGKRYRIGAAQQRSTTAREAITHFASAPLRNLQRLRRLTSFREEDEADTIWALRDVSFELARGQALGVIGQNGAGKSTLLKILSRITRPTRGRATVRGRVGSLLEVGIGFNPELTGRDNIYLNGSILGMDRAYIRQRFEEIVEFAGVEKFIDTPVKRYSSGMYVRLAFAVAAHLEPEILIVDEVLAVGDAAFQRKCLGKMSSVAGEGRTVLFVSHNLNAIESLCHRAIFLENGCVSSDGDSHEVVTNYLRDISSFVTDQYWPDIENAPGNDKVRLHRASLRPLQGTPRDLIRVDTDLVLEFEYWNLNPRVRLGLSLHVRTLETTLAFTSVSECAPQGQGLQSSLSLNRHILQVPGGLLNDEGYRIEFMVVDEDANLVYKHPDLLIFSVHNLIEAGAVWHGKWGGVVRPTLHWHSECISAGPAML